MPSMRFADVTGLVLAGGLGRRMGGVDKGLQLMDGKPLAAWVLERLEPQVGSVIINANQNAEAYGRFAQTVIPDRIGGFAGPLAGLHAGLAACGTPLLASVPCDSPFLPHDLVARLHEGLESAHAEVAIARSGGRLYPVFALLRRELAASVGEFLARGGRKAEDWIASRILATVDFDDAAAFANINTREELEGSVPERPR